MLSQILAFILTVCLSVYFDLAFLGTFFLGLAIAYTFQFIAGCYYRRQARMAFFNRGTCHE